jgi:hypothetical protein
MLIKDIAQKLAKLLDNRGVEFDFKSYDNKDDIPHIYINEERQNVELAFFNEIEGCLLCVDLENGEQLGICVNSMIYDGKTDDDIEKECEKMGIYNLFQDMYYEMNESAELGDFEDDFLAES